MFRSLLLLLGIVCLLACNKPEINENKIDPPELFTLLVPDSTGLTFKNPVPESRTMNGLSYEYYYNGGGVAIGDLNDDGLPDIFFTASVSPNKLYINQGGLKFVDETRQSNISDDPSWTTGVTMADVNADGLLDIYVCRSGRLSEEQRRNKLFINQGTGTNNIPQFKEMSKAYGLDDASYSTQSLFFDYDKDGDLDMYLLNHNVLTKRFEGFDREKRTALVGDKLYRNDGDRFIDVSDHAGIIGNEIGYGLGVAAGDVNGDGWADLYVSNDYDEHDYLYINNGDGTFTESSQQQLKHLSFYSMGVDIADYNNDGLQDIVSVDMVAEDNYRIKASMSGMAPERFWKAVEYGFHHQYMFNSLQRNNGNGTFSELAHLAGVSNTDWSWAVLLQDLNNDGLKDLFITNGLKRDFRNNDFVRFKEKVFLKNNEKQIDRDSLYYSLTRFIPERGAVNNVFENQGDLTFSKANTEWGLDVSSFSNGAALSDLDNDGDLDMVVNNIDAYAFVYENHSDQLTDHNFLKIRLKGPAGNAFGLGAKIQLTSAGDSQYYEHYLTRGFQSSTDPVIHFGLGAHNTVDELTITWPDDRIQVIRDIAANRLLEISHAKSVDKKPGKTPAKAAIFSDITGRLKLSASHKENAFNDFARESLLPHKMSEPGPAFAVGDVNMDGLDDLFYGASKGSAPRLFIQKADGSFQPARRSLFEKEKAYEDVDALFFDADGDGDPDLYVTSGGNEYEQGSKWYGDRLYINDGKGNYSKHTEALPSLHISASSVKAADFDQDGDLDLFIGGRQAPGKYPFPVSSTLLKNESNGSKILFKDVTEQVAPGFMELGMVTDAVWTNTGEDKYPDLVIVGEWMGVRVFENDGTILEDISAKSSLDNEKGWWYGIIAADFDNDGDEDLVAGNLGYNYKYKATHQEPFEVYADDFDDNQSIDIVLGYHNQGSLFPLRGRECTSNQMPFVKKKFATYDAFAKATLAEVYGAANLESALHYQATNFATSYIENLGGGKYRIKPLHNEAQVSCVNAILADDFNKDGQTDILLAGNNYGVEVETIRSDAGFGLLMQGNGQGDFSPVTSQKTGIVVDGVVKHTLKMNWQGHDVICFVKNNAPVQFVRCD
ncbi:VCBS repeat-containing protein [Fulvivirgaceae bacterium BMA10]|uniref:VCBS repeat-containing protein n=1 Tax=Splendidivirga corallicola TaxID=3051826 RepID=A0ABT8KX60_9BACT|nr:VCBS repeat-containing protein [Fulvivirgaceae bacterium BMA10]